MLGRKRRETQMQLQKINSLWLSERFSRLFLLVFQLIGENQTLWKFNRTSKVARKTRDFTEILKIFHYVNTNHTLFAVLFLVTCQRRSTTRQERKAEVDSEPRQKFSHRIWESADRLWGFRWWMARDHKLSFYPEKPMLLTTCTCRATPAFLSPSFTIVCHV